MPKILDSMELLIQEWAIDLGVSQGLRDGQMLLPFVDQSQCQQLPQLHQPSQTDPKFE